MKEKENKLKVEEDLVNSWINITMLLRENRILNDLSYNEMVVCRILENNEDPMTASDLVEEMKLYKSQINVIITGLERKKIIKRAEDPNDKRRMLLKLTEKSRYTSDHKNILEITDTLVEQMGEEKTKELTSLLEEATEIIKEKEEILI